MKIKIRDFVINIKISFFALLMLMIALNLLGQFFILLILVTLHELCHILTAYFYGSDCRELVITPVGFCAKINLDNLSFFQKLVVLFSGPLFNIIFGLFTGSMASIVLGIFNLLPVYPLDGGRIMNYTMGYILGTLRANRYVVSVSIGVCYGLLAAGVIQLALFYCNFTILAIAVFLLNVNKKEAQSLTYSFYKALIHKPNNKILRVRNVMVNKNTTLKTVIYRLGTDYYTVLNVRDGDIVGYVSEDKLQNFIIKNGISYNVIDVMRNL